MSDAQPILESHPTSGGALQLEQLAEILHGLEECAQVCLVCADACLAEETVAMLRRCIRLDLDAAAVCRVTADVVSRLLEPDRATVRAILHACVAACDVCADECAKHSHLHDHCRICAEACRACAQTCRDALLMLPAAGD